MGRPPRDPRSPARRRSFFATDAEWSAWRRTAHRDGALNLSAWLVALANKRADLVTAQRVRRKRKRCPACNQLLYIMNGDGSIEPHMIPPPLNGERPTVCPGLVVASRVAKRERSKR